MTTFTEAMPAFPVRDIEHFVRFYREKLDYTVLADGPGFALLERGGVALHLWLASDETWKQRGRGDPIVSGAESFLAGTVSCRILVIGIRDLYDACEASGIVHPNAALKGTSKNRPFVGG